MVLAQPRTESRIVEEAAAAHRAQRLESKGGSSINGCLATRWVPPRCGLLRADSENPCKPAEPPPSAQPLPEGAGAALLTPLLHHLIIPPPATHSALEYKVSY